MVYGFCGFHLSTITKYLAKTSFFMNQEYLFILNNDDITLIIMRYKGPLHAEIFLYSYITIFREKQY